MNLVPCHINSAAKNVTTTVLCCLVVGKTVVRPRHYFYEGQLGGRMTNREKAEKIVEKHFLCIGNCQTELIDQVENALTDAYNEGIEDSAKVVGESQKFHRSAKGLNRYEWIECLKNPIELARDIRSLKRGE